MASKDELIKQAGDMNIPLTGEETKPELEALIKGQIEGTKPEIPKDPASDRMIPASMVKELIAEALAIQAEKDKPQKVKRVLEHLLDRDRADVAHVPVELRAKEFRHPRHVYAGGSLD